MAKQKRQEKNGGSDDNTERPLIQLIEKILMEFTREIRDELALLKAKEQERNTQIMTALEDLQAAINESTVAQTDLTTAVNAAIVKISTTPVPADEAAITAAAVAVRANAASDVVLKDSLKAALNVPPPEPV